MSLDQYIEHVQRNVDRSDINSVAASATFLRALANDRTLVVKKLNEHVERLFSGAHLASAQSLVLGKGDGFYVRANIWPANADMANGRAYQNQFAYNLAHDHNFSFMTVNYLGPGYETEIYEYENARVVGYIGESVEFHFLEKVRFAPGTAMIYRASRDIHIQYAPEELTVTLNLMISEPGQQMRDQYYFDVNKRVITGYPDELLASRRTSLVNLAGHVGNADTVQLLMDLATKHPCRRTRLTALRSLVTREPHRSAEFWEIGCRDSEPLVSKTSEDQLRNLQT